MGGLGEEVEGGDFGDFICSVLSESEDIPGLSGRIAREIDDCLGLDFEEASY